MGIAAPLSFPARLRDLVRDGDARFVVTGAGGWLGQATLEMLDDALGPEMPGRVHAYAATTRPYRLRSGREIMLSSLRELEALERGSSPVAIAQYAFLTREKTATMTAAAYVEANRWITRFTIEQAGRLGARATFSTSSGAVYRQDGTLETSLADNPYGALKREEEEAFASVADRMGARGVLCRVFNLSGPFMNKDYALGSIVADVLARRTIRIRAPHRVVRSYAHVRDVVAVGFGAMLGAIEAPREPFDTGGAEAVEVGELANRAKLVLGRPDLEVERPASTGDVEDGYVGDGQMFRRLLERMGASEATLEDGIRDTAAYLENLRTDPRQKIQAQPSGAHA